MTSEIRTGTEAVVEALGELKESQDKVYERLDRHCEYLAQGLVDPDWSPELIRIMHHGTPPPGEDSDVEDELLRQEMEQVEQEMRELRHDRSMWPGGVVDWANRLGRFREALAQWEETGAAADGSGRRLLARLMAGAPPEDQDEEMAEEQGEDGNGDGRRKKRQRTE